MKQTSKSFLIISSLVVTSGVYAQNYNAGTGSSPGTGINNTVVGAGAGKSTSSGSANCLFGNLAGASLTSGLLNTFVGIGTGEYTTSGGANSFFGGSAGILISTGGSNTILGAGAGTAISTGSYNSFLGEGTGQNVNGNGNVFIGYNAGSKSAATTLNNQLYIDNSNIATPLIGGDFSARTAAINGALTVNTTNATPLAIQKSGVSVLTVGNDGTTLINSTSTTNAPFTVQRSGANILNLDIWGNFQAGANVIINNIGGTAQNAQLILKTYGGIGGEDANHGLGYFVSYNTTKNNTQTAVTVDGPVLYGFSGGALATKNLGASTSNIALQWNNSGQVYIGNQKQTTATGSHASALLSVSGDVVVGNLAGTAGIYLNQSNWADFVFDKNYTLMPLTDVEHFYKENHHLPNVPTTKEIQEKGNNLGQTDAILLQKIEESMLYIVELKNQLEAQQKQSETQQKLIEELAKKLADKK